MGSGCYETNKKNHDEPIDETNASQRTDTERERETEKGSQGKGGYEKDEHGCDGVG